MKEKQVWRNITVPYELFEMTTPKAIIFKIREGDFAGCSFVRPNKLVRKNRDFKGFDIGYPVTQQLDTNGDVVSEVAETIHLSKSEKQGDSWVVIWEQDIACDQLAGIIG